MSLGKAENKTETVIPQKGTKRTKQCVQNRDMILIVLMRTGSWCVKGKERLLWKDLVFQATAC